MTTRTDVVLVLDLLGVVDLVFVVMVVEGGHRLRHYPRPMNILGGRGLTLGKNGNRFMFSYRVTPLVGGGTREFGALVVAVKDDVSTTNSTVLSCVSYCICC